MQIFKQANIILWVWLLCIGVSADAPQVALKVVDIQVQQSAGKNSDQVFFDVIQYISGGGIID